MTYIRLKHCFRKDTYIRVALDLAYCLTLVLTYIRVALDLAYCLTLVLYGCSCQKESFLFMHTDYTYIFCIYITGGSVSSKSL